MNTDIDDERADEQFWAALLQSIEEKRLVPIIGRDLVTFRIRDKKTDEEIERSLYDLVAESVAAKLGVPVEKQALACPHCQQELPEHVNAEIRHSKHDLNDILCGHFDRRPEGDVQTAVRRAVEDLEKRYEPPEALRLLARIPNFTLFFTTTFDTMLEKALKLEGIAVQPLFPLSQSSVAELKRAKSPKGYEAFLMYMFGRANSDGPNQFAFADAQFLHYMHSIIAGPYQDVDQNPMKLLEDKDLLLIGVTFPDWLARFLIRAARHPKLKLYARDVRDPKPGEHAGSEYIVNSTVQSEGLKNFLDNFMSGQARMQKRQLSSSEFVRELSRRWWKAHPENARAPKPAPIVANDSKEDERRMVFISWCHEGGDKEHYERVETLYRKLVGLNEFEVHWDLKREDMGMEAAIYSLGCAEQCDKAIIVGSSMYYKVIGELIDVRQRGKQMLSQPQGGFGVAAEWRVLIGRAYYNRGDNPLSRIVSLRSEDDKYPRIMHGYGLMTVLRDGEIDESQFEELLKFLRGPVLQRSW